MNIKDLIVINCVKIDWLFDFSDIEILLFV